MAQKNYNYIVNKARKRTVGENQNYMIIIVGQTGSGKSYTGLSLAMMINKSFNIDRVCFRAKSFIENTQKDLDEGSVIMFDEAGIDVSARQWYSDRNKAINNVVETFRRDNLVCVWTTPNLGNLDKKVRSYFHGLAITMKPETWGYGAIKYFNLYPKVKETGVYLRYPVIRDNGQVVELGNRESPHIPNMYIVDPRDIDEQLVEAYEEKKKAFTEEVKEKAKTDLDESQNKEFTERDVIGLVSHHPDDYDLYNEDLSESQLAQRVFSKILAEHPDIELKKSQVGNVIGYIKDNTEEASESVRNPFEEYEEDLDSTIPESYAPIVKDLRKKGLIWREIAERLNVQQQRLYEEGRKWEGEDWEIVEELKSDEKSDEKESDEQSDNESQTEKSESKKASP